MRSLWGSPQTTISVFRSPAGYCSDRCFNLLLAWRACRVCAARYVALVVLWCGNQNSRKNQLSKILISSGESVVGLAIYRRYDFAVVDLGQ